MSWGRFGNSSKSQLFKSVDKLKLKFDNELYKVYESLDNLYYGMKLSIRILFNKLSKKIKVIITGKEITGERKKPLSKDVTELKTLKNIRLELPNIISQWEL